MIALRVYLWLVAAGVIFVCLVLGMVFAAGPRRADAGRFEAWRTGGIIAGVGLAVHAGYLLAPIAVGRAWSLWSLYLMAPVALTVLIATLASARFLLLPSRADTPRSAAGVLRKFGFIAAFYLAPPALVWAAHPSDAHPPDSPSPSADVERPSP